MKRSYTIQALLILLFGPLGLLYTSIILSIVFTLFFVLAFVAIASEPGAVYNFDLGKFYLFVQIPTQFFGALLVYGRNKDLQTKKAKEQTALQAAINEGVKAALQKK